MDVRFGSRGASGHQPAPARRCRCLKPFDQRRRLVIAPLVTGRLSLNPCPLFWGEFLDVLHQRDLLGID